MSVVLRGVWFGALVVAACDGGSGDGQPCQGGDCVACGSQADVVLQGDVHGVDPGACFAIHGQSALTVDLDGDGVDDQEIDTLVAVGVDRLNDASAICAEIAALLDNPGPDQTVVLSHVSRISEAATFQLFAPGETVDGADTSISVFEDGVAVLNANGEADGTVRIDTIGDALGSAPFSGTFTTTLTEDGEDDTPIDAEVTATYRDAPRCAEADLIALALAQRSADALSP